MNCVSIIVPVYNSEKYLERCVLSLINQTYKNIEIILVNDGSTDNSGAICDKFKDKYKNIKVIHKDNGGVSSARNVALKQAVGKYVGFADSDDYAEPNMFELLVETLENSNAQLVSCGMIHEDKKKLKTNQGQLDLEDIEILEISKPYHEVLNNPQIAGYATNKLYLKEFINHFYNESLAQNEDLLFVAEYLKSVVKMVHIKQKLYHYQTGEVSPSLIFNSRILTLPSAYEKILEHYNVHSPEYAYIVKKNLLKIYLNFKGRYLITRCDDDKLLTTIKNGIKRYKASVLKEKSISFKEKFNIRITSLFPKTMLRIKIKRLKVRHKKGNWEN